MENAETILVIILSSFLALFLLLAIILLIKCLKIANQVKRIADKAETIVDKADSAADFIAKAATHLSVSKLVTQFASNLLGKLTDNAKRRK